MLTATTTSSLPSQLAAVPASPRSGSTGHRPRSDAELMALAAQGRTSALAEIYGRYDRMLMALALRILRNRSDAEDVLQEVFLYVWKQAWTYNAARSSVATWLVLITRSRSLDRLKMHRRLSERVADSDLDRVIEIEGPVEEGFEKGFDRILNLERRQRIREELARLPLAQRQVLDLFYFHGLTQKEVAERLSIPIGTVKTRALLAVKKLRRAFGPEIVHLA